MPADTQTVKTVMNEARPAARPAAARAPQSLQAEAQRVRATGTKLVNEVAKVIVGKKEVMELVLIDVLSEGNILFEDYPGLAKTVMASTFARASGCVFKRIQFTPDVLPADITGSMVYDQKAGEFEFRPGPVFTNFLLADEINRAPPKSQSALLEAMAEKQVSVEGTTHKLDKPYIVMATQNPVEQEGTYPLPEAQMDRFLMKLSVGYPNKAEEQEIGRRRIQRRKDDFDVTQVTSPQAIQGMQGVCERLQFHDAVLEYIASIVVNTRNHEQIKVGSSPRGTLALIKASRAAAALKGRHYVTPDDVRRVAKPIIAHRLILEQEAKFSGVTGESLVDEILQQTPAPTV